MFKAADTQGAKVKILVDDYMLTWLEAFRIDREAQGILRGNYTFLRNQV